MSFSSKIRVGVARGGPSKEHEVSLKTGAHILRNLPDKYIPADIYIDKGGVWHFQGVASTPAKIFPKIDVLFNALHGEFGEDGRLQHLLDIFGVSYTGSRQLACAFAMNKLHAKKILQASGVKSPYHKVIRKSEFGTKKAMDEILLAPLPAIVKPVSLGSSLGVSLVTKVDDFRVALKSAFALSDAALIEECISGREATCGLIEAFRGNELYTLLPVEFSHEGETQFLDYDAKYGKKSRAISPGRFSRLEKDAIQKATRVAHTLLGLRHYSRSDFIVSPNRGVYFLETNSLPGLYADAPYTESLLTVGTPFPEFLHHVLQLALAGK